MTDPSTPDTGDSAFRLTRIAVVEYIAFRLERLGCFCFDTHHPSCPRCGPMCRSTQAENP